jgi:hypothetical protein
MEVVTLASSDKMYYTINQGEQYDTIRAHNFYSIPDDVCPLHGQEVGTQ